MFVVCISSVVANGCYLWRGLPAGLTSVDVSADSTVVITGSEDMTAKISNLHTGKVLGTFQGTEHVSYTNSTLGLLSITIRVLQTAAAFVAAQHGLRVQHSAFCLCMAVL